MPFPKVAVVIPAYCEEMLIRRTVEGVPPWVDAIYVVDDASPDGTLNSARASGDPRLTVLRHDQNRGVGAAIFTGYRRAFSDGCEIVAVMAGDNQMDPNDLLTLVQPIVDGTADYVKGNRLVHPQHREMPVLRRWGTRVLARVTSWACGKEVGDTQCGYTALRASAAASLDLSDLWPRYGYPNDLLLALLWRGYRLEERPVRPVYRDEKSGLRPWHMLSILYVIARRRLLRPAWERPRQRLAS